jgi:hypothetical protein
MTCRLSTRDAARYEISISGPLESPWRRDESNKKLLCLRLEFEEREGSVTKWI